MSTLLAVIWCFAALVKALDYQGFQEVVTTHAVLPGSALSFLWVVPLGEGALALGILNAVGTASRVRILRRVLIGAVLTLMLFAAYIALVPGAIIEAVGCGCFGVGGTRLISGIPLSARMTSLALAGLMIAAHAFAYEWSVKSQSA
ncbi:MAG: hypothetical protein DYG94_12505 [Leptolyngbya sp. PLA3]|nr:MAG: hypothetical protein EDM82_12950 [Cyanobacteria bacterium CYA]MCE7969547.1 hypothetical protein [Leptolyngbya sp. PL-A3]